MSSPLFQKAVRKNVFLKIAVTGPSGSGKTTGALLLARGLVGPTGKIALIDTENGSASLYADRFEFDVLDVAPPFDNDKFISAVTAAVDNGYEAVIIDSASHFWEGILAYKDQLDSRGGNSYTNWKIAGDKFSGIIKAVLQSRIHVICCMRSKMDYVQEKDDRGKTQVKKVGLAPIMRDGIEYEFTSVFDVGLNHQAAVSKDRTGLFTDKIFMITEDTGKALNVWRNSGAAVPAGTPAVAAAPSDTLSAAESTTKLIAAIGDHEAAANALLLRLKWIVDGQTYRDVDAKRMKMILDNPSGFLFKAGVTV